MIIHLKSTVDQNLASKLAVENKAFHIIYNEKHVLITGSGLK
jgi:hypothetical protein